MGSSDENDGKPTIQKWAYNAAKHFISIMNDGKEGMRVIELNKEKMVIKITKTQNTPA